MQPFLEEAYIDLLYRENWKLIICIREQVHTLLPANYILYLMDQDVSFAPLDHQLISCFVYKL